MKTKIFSLFIVMLIIAISCNKDEGETSNQVMTKEEIATENKMDKSIDDIDAVIEEEYLIQSGFRSSSNTTARSHCGTVTAALNGNTWSVTIDFGTTGCTLANGNILKGKIILSFTNDFQAMTKVISYTFENFSHNDISINGSRTLTRVKANTNGHPESRFDIDMTLTLANGDVFTRTGLRVNEWTEGYDSPTKDDDVHLITGSWSTSSPIGTRTATITVPLKKLGTCQYIVEGIVEFTRNDNHATLDYGTGTCDNEALLIINGGDPITIML